jgi:hypothetical protein
MKYHVPINGSVQAAYALIHIMILQETKDLLCICVYKCQLIATFNQLVISHTTWNERSSIQD